VLPDCAERKYPSVGELETLRLASSTTLSLIVSEVEPVTSPVCVKLVLVTVSVAVAKLVMCP